MTTSDSRDNFQLFEHVAGAIASHAAVRARNSGWLHTLGATAALLIAGEGALQGRPDITVMGAGAALVHIANRRFARQASLHFAGRSDAALSAIKEQQANPPADVAESALQPRLNLQQYNFIGRIAIHAQQVKALNTGNAAFDLALTTGALLFTPLPLLSIAAGAASVTVGFNALRHWRQSWEPAIAQGERLTRNFVAQNRAELNSHIELQCRTNQQKAWQAEMQARMDAAP